MVQQLDKPLDRNGYPTPIPSRFFVAGGNLSVRAPSYVKREADEALFKHTLAGRFCYVLTARQMGKSSLMIRTHSRLNQEGVHTAIIDLTSIGTKAVEVWYLDLLDKLSTELNLEVEAEQWWQENTSFSPVHRFIDFLQQVVLQEISDKIVIFIDEIDSTLNLDFSDDFFVAIRHIYNARASQPIFNRLTFVLLGAASPADLIEDRTRTPFNIGQAVALREFSRSDALVLQEGLEAIYPGKGAMIFARIYYWTNGHPYLTQKLCLAVAESNYRNWTNDRVDRLIAQYFLSEEARKDTNLQFIQDRIITSADQQALLRLYSQVYTGKQIPEDEHSIAQNQLRLFGLLGAEEGTLVVRNRIYQRFFNQDWINAHMERVPTRPTWRLLTVLIVTMFIVPLGLALIFKDLVRDQPLIALLALGFYVAIMMGFVFALFVLQRLRRQWAGMVSTWLDFTIRDMFVSRQFRQTYLQALRYEHRFFNVKGLTTQGIFTLELDRVFVPLSIVSQPDEINFNNPIQAPTEEGAIIWDLIKSPPMINRNLVIVGAPGSGKTTLLQHMALVLATSKKKRQQLKVPNKLPILLFLRDHSEAIQKDPGYSLPDALQANMAAWDVDIPSSWFEEMLKRGNCLVMLDGLDEVADPAARLKVVKWVETEMTNYHNVQFIITSRPFGYYSNPLREVITLGVCAFTMTQVEAFIHNWYRANEIMSAQMDDKGVEMQARRGANDLIKRLRRSAPLSDLAVNPLLLTMIATVHRYRSMLPDQRVQLYAEICEVFLGKRRQAMGLIMSITSTQKQRVLEHLAYHMMRQEIREIALAEALKVIEDPLKRVSSHLSGEAFLKLVETSSGLILERESGVYGFAHLTFQEYLASAHVREQDLEAELEKHVEESWWYETIRLYAARANATGIIVACLQKTHSSSALSLALDCLEEAQEIDPDVRQDLEWLTAVRVDEMEPDLYRLRTEALLNLRLKRMVRLNNRVFIDRSLIANSEYQLFLSARNGAGRYHQPDHWRSSKIAAGQENDPITGVRPEDALAFCAWLTARADDGWRYRLPQASELGLDQFADNQEADYWITTEEGQIDCTADMNISLGENQGLFIEQPNIDLTRARVLNRALLMPPEHDSRLINLIRYFAYAPKRHTAMAHIRAFGLPESTFDLVVDLGQKLSREVDNNLRQVGIRPGVAQNQSLNLNVARQLGLEQTLKRVVQHVTHIRDAIVVERVIQSENLIHNQILSGQELVQIQALIQVLKRSSVDEPSLYLNLTDIPKFDDLAHSYAPFLDDLLSIALDRSHKQMRERLGKQRVNMNQVLDSLYWYIRLTALGLSIELQAEINVAKEAGTRRLHNRSPRISRDQAQYYIEVCLDLYADFTILQERIKQSLPALESIRLAKERI